MKGEAFYSMPHPEPKKHKRMPLNNRAAQFAPFAALTGYDEQIAETVRTTDGRISMAEDLCEDIYRNLQILFFAVPRPSCATVTYFVPDLFKSGGKYVTVCGTVTAVNREARTVTVEGVEISLDAITDLALN